MATALAYPDDGERGRGKKSLANNDFNNVSSGYVRQARFVLRNCRDKAIEVLRNAKYPRQKKPDGITRPAKNQPTKTMTPELYHRYEML